MKNIIGLVIVCSISMNMFGSETVKRQLANYVKYGFYYNAVSLFEQHRNLCTEVIKDGKDAQTLVTEEIQMQETVGAEFDMHRSSEQAEMQQEYIRLKEYIIKKKSEQLQLPS